MIAWPRLGLPSRRATRPFRLARPAYGDIRMSKLLRKLLRSSAPAAPPPRTPLRRAAHRRTACELADSSSMSAQLHQAFSRRASRRRSTTITARPSRLIDSEEADARPTLEQLEGGLQASVTSTSLEKPGPLGQREIQSNTQNDQIMLISSMNITVGRIVGRSTCQKVCQREAPSTRAASISSGRPGEGHEVDDREVAPPVPHVDEQHAQQRRVG